MKKVLYGFLYTLLLYSLWHQWHITELRLRSFLYPDQVIEPPIETFSDNPKIRVISSYAAGSGIHKGDSLTAINGVPNSGANVLANALQNRKPADQLTITVRHPEQNGLIQNISLTLKASEKKPTLREWLLSVVLSIAIPVFCLSLAFWVALLRPMDPLAWLLLGMLLSFSQFPLGFSPNDWTHWQRPFVLSYYTIFVSTWPVWMLLFGIYFPERSHLDKRAGWIKWMFIVPLGFFALMDLFMNLSSLNSYSLAATVDAWIQPFQTLRKIIGMVAVGIFFALLGTKSGTAASPDARRRLKLLLTGAEVSLSPMFVLAIISLIRHKDIFEGIPDGIVLISLLMLFLFPITLAYVIVVQRALDVRVVIRLGVQYALARSGFYFILILVCAVIGYFSLSVFMSAGAGPLTVTILLAANVGLVLLLKHWGVRLEGWIDRRFFREAYNSEQILNELSNQVRTMIETSPLLQTVSQRIAESLHVPNIAFVLGNENVYRTAHAQGYSQFPNVSFTQTDTTIRNLTETRLPLRIYVEDSSDSLVRVLDADEKARLRLLNSQLLLPLALQDKLLGMMSLGPKQSEAPYSNRDLHLLQSVAGQTALALENSRLSAAVAAEVAQRERINRELEIARQVQQRLFPQTLPTIAGLNYAASCRPASSVGGDYYDFLIFQQDKLALAIGDVSGKGIAAALLMASLQASLRSQVIQGLNDPATILRNVNRLVYEASASNRYATFFYAHFDPAERTLQYVNAGHNPPFLLRKTNNGWQTERLKTGGPVVGLLPDFVYNQAKETLNAGDLLVAYTDGISESMNTAEEEWGEQRLLQTILQCDGADANTMIEQIMKSADSFVGAAQQHDDMTLMVARFL